MECVSVCSPVLRLCWYAAAKSDLALQGGCVPRVWNVGQAGQGGTRVAVSSREMKELRGLRLLGSLLFVPGELFFGGTGTERWFVQGRSSRVTYVQGGQEWRK